MCTITMRIMYLRIRKIGPTLIEILASCNFILSLGFSKTITFTNQKSQWKIGIYRKLFQKYIFNATFLQLLYVIKTPYYWQVSIDTLAHFGLQTIQCVFVLESPINDKNLVGVMNSSALRLQKNGQIQSDGWIAARQYITHANASSNVQCTFLIT